MRKRYGIILFVLIAFGGGILWLLLSGEPIEEGRCKLIRSKVPADSQLVGLAVQMLEPLPAQPEGVRDLPAGFSRPCYYEMRSGARRIPLVVNLSDKPNLCLDTDGDGVLAQERCLEATSVRRTRESGDTWRFGPISPAFPDSAGTAESGFYVDCYRVDAPGLLLTRPAFFRTGKLRVEGRTYRVAVVDGDCDDQFRSFLSLPLDRAWRCPGSDVFAIDRTRDGQFQFSPYGQSEVMPLGHLLQMANTYYAIDIAPDGTSLTLTRTQPESGTLAIEPNHATVGLKLWSDASEQYLRGHQWQLPAGRYKAVHATWENRDASGDTWSFSSNLSSAFTCLGSLESFVIQPGETTAIRIGPPFVVKAEVQKISPGLVSVNSVLVGCAGEQYLAGCQRNGRRAPAPSFQIVDEKGTVLVTDKFQYG